MSYGTIKVDNITFTDNSVDKTVSLSGLIQNPTFTGNVTVTGTISGDVIRGGTTISGVTVTGTTANFVSGVFTTQVSGTTITGTTVATTTGSFVSLTGTTATFTSGIIASGTAALPSLAILSDPNTGIYSPGADQLAISTNGTQRLLADSAGGVTVPTRFIIGQVNNVGGLSETTRTTSGIFNTSRLLDGGTNPYLQTGAEAGIVYFNADGSSAPATVFRVGGTERLRITSTGALNFVGAGTAGSTQAVSFNGSAPVNSLVIDSSGRLLVGTSTATGPAILQIQTPTTLSTAADTGVRFANTSTKVYPTTSSFSVIAGLNQSIELGTAQTVNTVTPGGFNFLYGTYLTLTKSAGNTQDIERLYFNGFAQSFSWADGNTCKQYVGFSDTFTYSGYDANARTSSSLNAESEVTLSPPDTRTQTIGSVVSPSITLSGSGTNTINLTTFTGISTNINFYSLNAGTKTRNVTNAIFYDTSEYWGTFAAIGTINATITNLFGLRLRPPEGIIGLTITNNWGIYQEWSSAKNWFAGASNQFPNITTTASGANAFLDSADSNRLYRSTSSLTYKRDVEDLDSSVADQILNLRPVWYRSKCEADCKDWSWYGLIAEEVAEIDPRFVHYGYQEDAYEFVETTKTVDLKPDDPRREAGIETTEITRQERQLKPDAKQVPNGVAYERLVVPLLDIIKRQKSQLDSFEARLSALEGA